MPDAFVIPTRLRDPLIKGWSYPVGAELVSRALQRIPQLAEIELTFRSTKRPSLDEWRGCLVAAQYWRPPKDFVRVMGGPHEIWQVTVHAVPSTQRARVRRLLLDDGLAHLAAWFSEPRPENWRFGRHRLWIGCDAEVAGVLVEDPD